MLYGTLDEIIDRIERENMLDVVVKKPTNAERIRAMSDEELAWVFMEFRVSCYAKSIGDEGSFPDTYHGILEWLQQPVMERTLSKKLAETEK